jgi:hypothetical protein
MSDALALLMVIVSEVRWHTHDAAAIEHVLRRYARRHDVSIAQAAEQVVWPHNRARKITPWLKNLNLDCTEPQLWNEARWPAKKCQRLVTHIKQFLARRVADPCRGRATGWRSPDSQALRFALRHGFAVVDCGPTLITFVRPVAPAPALNVESRLALR